MTYQRFIGRNRLTGDYSNMAPYRDENGAVAERDRADDLRHHIAGELRRLERNSRDPRHLDAIGRKAGVPPEHVKAVLDTFFASDFPEFDWEQFPVRWTEEGVAIYDDSGAVGG